MNPENEEIIVADFDMDSDASRSEEILKKIRKPPRKVSLSLFLAQYFGTLGLFGAFFFGFGMIFVWLMFNPEAIYEDFLINKDGVSVKGKITGSRRTNTEVNEERVYFYSFEFETENGMETGGSYSTDTFNNGQTVNVEYLKKDPKIARIEDTGRSEVGLLSALVLIFPLVGGLIMLGQFRDGIKMNNLLKNGKATLAEVGDVLKTGTTYNKQPEFKITYSYQDDKGNSYSFNFKTYDVTGVTDEPNEVILYNPNNPKQAAPLDGFHGRVEPLGNGDWKPTPMGPVLLKLLGFLICTVPHLIMFWYRYLAK